PRLTRFVQDLVRALPADAFNAPVEVSRLRLARRLGVEEARLERGLRFLQERTLVRWYPGDGCVLVSLLAPRTAHVPYDESVAASARRRSEVRLEDMVRYARSTTCRRQF